MSSRALQALGQRWIWPSLPRLFCSTADTSAVTTMEEAAEASCSSSSSSEEMDLDDIANLITSKCRLLANPNLPYDREEKEEDPVKIFQDAWLWQRSSDCRYEDSPTSSSLPSHSSRKQRMEESKLLREIASSVAKNGWNDMAKQEFVMKIPQIDPFHVCHILKGIQEPRCCIQIFEWVRNQPGYKHTTRSYNALASILASSKENAISLKFLQEKMENDGCEPDQVTLSTLIRGFSKAQQPQKVLEIYYRMRENEWEPGIVTYSCIIDILAKHGYTDKAREIYFEMRMNGCYLDRTGYNILINLFGRKKNVHMANTLYKEMCECGLKPDGYTYAALIQAHLRTGDIPSAYGFFTELIDKKLSMSLSTCNSLIYALGKAGELDLALKVYFQMSKFGLEAETHTYSTLINAFGPKGKISDLEHLVEDMASKGHIEPELAYSKAMEWLIQGGSIDSACKLVLAFTKKKASSNTMLIDSLMENLLKIGAMDQIHDFLKELVTLELKPDIHKLNDLVKKLAENGNVEGALKIFYAMGELGYTPGCIAYDCILLCLTRFGSLYQALRFFEDMSSSQARLMPTLNTCNHLINVLCIKGDMKVAHDVFNKMVAGGCAPNVGTYSQLIGGYASISDWAMAFKLSKDMEDVGLVADCETYMPLILSLGNEGRVDHACQLCEQMLDRGLRPSRQECIKLLEMFSRKGYKQCVVDMFEKLKSMKEFQEFTSYDSYLMQRCS